MKNMNASHKILILNIINILTMFFSVQETNAHTDSLKVWRFVYEVSDVNYKDRGYNDLMNLDVKSDGSSFFYSIYNSVNNKTQYSDSEVKSIINGLDSQRKGARYKILRNAPTNEITFVTDAPDNFYYKENNIKMQWNIIDKDTMVICGYICKKATTFFAGRSWIAWFSEDLPISCGPWKFSGLPGLILSAYDTDNYFKFFCIGIEQTKCLPWNVNSKQYIKCTNDEYQKQLRLHAADPVNYALRKLGLPTVSVEDVSVTDENGKAGNVLPKFENVFMEKISEEEK